jgi:hypothetical protein
MISNYKLIIFLKVSDFEDFFMFNRVLEIILHP